MNLLIITLSISFLLGSALASFVHCWAHRLYGGHSFKRRSHCPQCQKIIAWFYNIPVFSYLWLRGRCAYCHRPISKDYLASELIGGLALSLAWLAAWFSLGGEAGVWAAITTYNFWLIFAQAMIGFIMLMLVFWSDYWWMSVFVSPLLISSVLLAGIGLLVGQSWQSLAGGAIFGSLFFAAQFWLSKGRWVGEGDIYLGLFLGIWLGWPLIVPTIFAAYMMGAVVGLFLLASGQKDRTAKLPLGVFLAPSGWLFFLLGQQLWQAYLHWLGW